MVRLGLVLALMAGPAAAGCFGPPFPKKVHFDNGQTMEVVSHTAQDLTVRSVLPDGTMQAALRSGLFALSSSGSGVTQHFEWLSDLPDLGGLQPGQRFSLEADMIVEHASRSYYHVDLVVLRQDSVRVGGCDYPVIVVQRFDRLSGVTSSSTLWIAPRLLMALRTISALPGDVRTNAVTGFE